MRSGNMARESPRRRWRHAFPPGRLPGFRSGDAGACPLGGRLFLDANRRFFLLDFRCCCRLATFGLLHHAADDARRMLEMLLQDLAGFEVARERQFLDELVLFADRRVDIGIDHEAASITFELIVEDVAEMQEPWRAAAGLERLVEFAVAPLPFVMKRLGI